MALVLILISTVQVITVRGTSFEAAPAEGGSAASEDVALGDLPTDLSQFIGQELSKSDRPELTAAKVGNESFKICCFYEL